YGAAGCGGRLCDAVQRAARGGPDADAARSLPGAETRGPSRGDPLGARRGDAARSRPRDPAAPGPMPPLARGCGLRDPHSLRCAAALALRRRRGASMSGDAGRLRRCAKQESRHLAGSLALLAGGLGFEPRLAESESAVLPLDDPPNPVRPQERKSALAELRPAARLAPADFLALDLARVARDEAGSTKRLAQLRIEIDQRARDAVADRTRLARDAAPFNPDIDVEAIGHMHELERLSDDHHASLASKKLVEGAAIDRDCALAELEENARRG